MTVGLPDQISSLGFLIETRTQLGTPRTQLFYLGEEL